MDPEQAEQLTNAIQENTLAANRAAEKFSEFNQSFNENTNLLSAAMEDLLNEINRLIQEYRQNGDV
jgi:Tfp pilus assembly PilM family ATPase